MKRRDEALVYNLSVRLGVEVYLVGVGKQIFLPYQRSSIGHVETEVGGLTEWIIACAQHPDQVPWWVHTHPGMTAFFSITDIDGANRLWHTLHRPFRAIILGEGSRREEVIDEKWLDDHRWHLRWLERMHLRPWQRHVTGVLSAGRNYHGWDDEEEEALPSDDLDWQNLSGFLRRAGVGRANRIEDEEEENSDRDI